MKRVVIENYCFEHNVPKILKKSINNKDRYDILTDEKNQFSYDSHVIQNSTTSSANHYEKEEKITKTRFINLFSDISENDIWSATYLINEKDKEWSKALVTKIQSMDYNEAVSFVKKNHLQFGKMKRDIIGQKIQHGSSNNYYLVRDLSLYFQALEGGDSVKTACNKSTRKLDINTLQTLIFNNVKYELKK